MSADSMNTSDGMNLPKVAKRDMLLGESKVAGVSKVVLRGGSARRHDSYRATLHIRNCPPIGPYCRTMPRALWRS